MGTIKNIEAATLKKILNKSAHVLPDNPTALGMSPSEIKEYLHAFVTDADDSVLSELSRVIEELNTYFDKQQIIEKEYVTGLTINGKNACKTDKNIQIYADSEVTKNSENLILSGAVEKALSTVKLLINQNTTNLSNLSKLIETDEDGCAYLYSSNRMSRIALLVGDDDFFQIQVRESLDDEFSTIIKYGIVGGTFKVYAFNGKDDNPKMFEINRESLTHDLLNFDVKEDGVYHNCEKLLKYKDLQLSISVDDNYVATFVIVDNDGNEISEPKTIDLPLEEMIIAGEYIAEDRDLLLRLKNGNSVSIPLDDVISGLLSKNDVENLEFEKLQTNKITVKEIKGDKVKSTIDTELNLTVFKTRQIKMNKDGLVYTGSNADTQRVQFSNVDEYADTQSTMGFNKAGDYTAFTRTGSAKMASGNIVEVTPDNCNGGYFINKVGQTDIVGDKLNSVIFGGHTEHLSFLGEYTDERYYSCGDDYFDIVLYQGRLYRTLAQTYTNAVKGIPPTDTQHWRELVGNGGLSLADNGEFYSNRSIGYWLEPLQAIEFTITVTNPLKNKIKVQLNSDDIVSFKDTSRTIKLRYNNLTNRADGSNSIDTIIGGIPIYDEFQPYIYVYEDANSNGEVAATWRINAITVIDYSGRSLVQNGIHEINGKKGVVIGSQNCRDALVVDDEGNTHIKGNLTVNGDTFIPEGGSAVGIKSVNINDKGELIITFTDGKVNNLGVVKGADGKDGKNGSPFSVYTNNGEIPANGGILPADMVIGKDVCEIGENAFSTVFNSIKIDGGNRDMIFRKNAFASVSEALIIPAISFVLNATVEDEYSFPRAKNMYTVSNGVKTLLTNVNFSSMSSPSWTEIPLGCFWGNESIQSLAIGGYIKKIGARAFQACISLTSVTLNNLRADFEEIGDNAFYKCEQLSSLPIFNTLKTIGKYAFAYTAITDFSIPETVTKIPNGLFYTCTNLISVTIPNTVTEIGNEVFCDCKVLKTITATGVRKLGTFTFGGFSSKALTSIDLGGNEVEVSAQSFSYCPSLTSINASKLIGYGTSTGGINYIFQYDSALETIPPFDLQNIVSATSAFYNCKKLTNLTLLNVNTNLTIGSASTYGHLLTLDSLINTVKELWTQTSTKTLTMGSANTAKIANVYVKLVDITDEMREADEHIDKKKPCEVCESTDTGAMTLRQYATLKGWNIQ